MEWQSKESVLGEILKAVQTVKSLGKMRPSFPQGLRKMIVAYIQETNISTATMSRKVGITQTTLHRWLKEYGKKPEVTHIIKEKKLPPPRVKMWINGIELECEADQLSTILRGLK